MQTLVKRNDKVIEELLAVDAMIDQIKGRWYSLDDGGKKVYEDLEKRKLKLLQKLAISS
ncbi:MAG: hypothetical protein SVM80_08470 [Halobacteriota archaeon]|nr:hypothetical protein [Halobacteriota archaeon]